LLAFHELIEDFQSFLEEGGVLHAGEWTTDFVPFVFHTRTTFLIETRFLSLMLVLLVGLLAVGLK
jgi:hypothetical protein